VVAVFYIYDLTIGDDTTVAEHLLDMPQEGWQVHTHTVTPQDPLSGQHRHYILWEREVLPDA
jgi:hypothetical protein